jgi:hypothetical protein
VTVDELMDLRRKTAPGTVQGVVSGLGQQILVVRSRPRVAGEVRAVLVGVDDRGLHTGVPVHDPGGICAGQQGGEDLVPGSVAGVAAMLLPTFGDWPGAETY